MMKLIKCILLLLLPVVGSGQIITTVAGNGQLANTGDGGQATSAATNYPAGVVVDRNGNLYISMGVSGNSIRKVSASGVISTVAGGMAGYSGDGGLAMNAKMNWPGGINVDSLGNIFIAEFGNHVIRRVDISSGIITTIAGNGVMGYNGDNGSATTASLNYPADVCFDKFGNIYIADGGNNRIRKINTSGMISTFAGTGNLGHNGDGGLAINAELTSPSGLATDDTGNIYIADAMFVRKVNLNGIISTVAGNGVAGSDGDGGLAINAKTNVFSIAFDRKSEALYICENDNNQIRRVDKLGIITTVAGNGNEGFSGDGGLAVNAELDDPFGICLDSCGNLYIADGHNRRVRKVAFSDSCGTLSTQLNTASTSTLSIHPNPATSTINITSSNKIKQVTIADITGREVLHSTVNTIDVSGLVSGVYFVRVWDVSGGSIIEKVLKQ